MRDTVLSVRCWVLGRSSNTSAMVQADVLSQSLVPYSGSDIPLTKTNSAPTPNTQHPTPLIAAILAAISLAGCTKPPTEYPLAVGKTWTYNVRTHFISYQEPVKVSRELSVAGTKGYVLSGPMGSCRIGWREGTLYADSLLNTTFNPPLPMLVSGQPEASLDWEGYLTVLGKQRKGHATLSQKKESVTLGWRTVPTTRAKLLIEVEDHEIELITWYAVGQGPVKQEQRTDGRQIINLEILSSD